MMYKLIENIALGENRQRREFDDAAMLELETDILYQGLMHPVVVREEYNGNTYEKTVLVSGERRLRALTVLHYHDLPVKFDGAYLERYQIPTVCLGELSAIEAEEAELSENICRKDLTWQERASAEIRLHRLRSEQAEAAGRVQTLTQTAQELAGGSRNTFNVSERERLVKSLTVVGHLSDKDVQAASSLDDALKIVRKKIEAEHRVNLAAQLGPTLKTSRHTLLHGDCFTLASLGQKFDVVLTDPPYSVGADSFGSQGSRERHYDDELDFAQFARFVHEHSKPEAHLYVFCAFERFSRLRYELMQYNAEDWSVWPRPLIWSKGNGVLPIPDGGPRYTYECILYARRGNKKVLQIGSDVLTYSSPATTGHPDQKPVDLYAELLRRSCLPGDTVLDPFAGSGTIFAAANRLMLTATGIEKSEQYYAMASQRMESKE